MTTSLRPTGATATPVGIAGPPAHAPDGEHPADPVKALMRRHHALCAAAVHPLEIAAGLEKCGINDRVAAEYRHRDVFSLAEELHARVERDAEPPGQPSAHPHDPWRAEREHGPGACAALRGGWGAAGTLAWLWLAAYALAGDWLVTLLLHGRRGLAGRTLVAVAVSAAAPTALALACAIAPAAWCAHWFTARARRVLAVSRGLAEFGRQVRPALLVAVALFLGALLAFLWPARTALPTGGPLGATTPPALAYTAVAALGGLFFLARLLAAHGLARPAVAATLAAALAEAVPLGTLLAARLPGCEALRWPVGRAASTFGPAALPLVACALPALALLAHAVPALSRASVHGHADAPHPPRPAVPVRLGASPVPDAQGHTRGNSPRPVTPHPVRGEQAR
ncbi:hypothetical protein AB0F13_02335 [Streptomyces sp. NPDC026206]|uniref:hypothetical protein n=1 Tax=Streptomyces sp. NPDC026206 TaxID=3157089 RepID=UPI0033CC71F0